uniref:Uncharacterized protein n=1 Tax=Romanomermis culicivorax TaxID=13658 RepID=A0A915IMJ1_ROMCU
MITSHEKTKHCINQKFNLKRLLRHLSQEREYMPQPRASTTTMEHEFSLGGTVGLVITINGKFVKAYFCKIKPETLACRGKSFKMI